jgi:hypothetical protein
VSQQAGVIHSVVWCNEGNAPPSSSSSSSSHRQRTPLFKVCGRVSCRVWRGGCPKKNKERRYHVC